MIDLQIRVNDQATPVLRGLALRLSPAQRRDLMLVLGRQIEGDVRRHFALRDQAPNKQGFPRSHFWAREGRAKTALVGATESGATIAIASAAIAHKLDGGTIRPGPGRKYLAIPVRGEVAGKLARSNPVPGLFFLRVRGRAWLAAREAGRPDGALRVFYRLLRSVTQAADPRTLPEQTVLEQSARTRTEAWIERRAGK